MDNINYTRFGALTDESRKAARITYNRTEALIGTQRFDSWIRKQIASGITEVDGVQFTKDGFGETMSFGEQLSYARAIHRCIGSRAKGVECDVYFGNGGFFVHSEAPAEDDI